MTLSNGTTIADRYRLMRLIATGGMGQVWEALDTRLNRRVAVKVLKSEYTNDPEFTARFRTGPRPPPNSTTRASRTSSTTARHPTGAPANRWPTW